MDTMLVAVFDSEKEASKAAAVLQDLHAEGAIFAYAVSVIVRTFDNIGIAQFRDGDLNPDQALETATRSLIQLLETRSDSNEPDHLIDMARAGIDAEFISQVSRHLAPGTAAVVTEVEEEKSSPIDPTSIFRAGIVLRCVRRELADAKIANDLDRSHQEIKTLEQQLSRAGDDSKPMLRRNLGLALERFQLTKNLAKRQAESIKREAEAKIASLQARAAMAQGASRARLERLTDEVRVDYVNRATKLNLAWQFAGEMFAA